MDGRIGHLRSRYRVVGGAAGSRAALTARLERIVRERLADSLDAALGSAFEGDEAVYVLRRVRAGALLQAGDGATDAGLAHAWGERLAGAVVRAVARDEGDGANLVRFDDQADYVAHFIAAVLAGGAWGRWYFGAFAPLRTLPTRDVLRTVLLENRERAPSILGRLEARGQLEALLAALDGETLRALWRGDEGREDPAADAERLRPIFAAALRLVGDLGLRDGAGADDEALLRDYAARARDADWRDARSLAAALLDALGFLKGRGRLRGRVDDGEFQARLGDALRRLDWLDAAWLRGEVVRLLAGGAALPPRPARAGPTPRQRELLGTLAALAGEGALRLAHDGDVAADALRVWAALAARAPAWADDAAARALVGHLLEVARLLRTNGRAQELALRLRRGDAEGALALLSASERAASSAACRVTAGLASPALDVASALAHAGEQGRAGAWVESRCAGVSLLLRAALDLRLHALAAEASYPPEQFTAETRSTRRERGGLDDAPRPAPSLRHRRLGGESFLTKLWLAVSLRLGGDGAVDTEGFIDEGLCLFAGLEAEGAARPTLEELSAEWGACEPVDEARLQSALLGAAAGQRLLDVAEMRVARAEFEGVGAVLIACDAGGAVWPLGRVLEGRAGEVEEIVGEWLAAWEEATGVRPAVVFEDAEAEVCASLTSAWRALAHGRLGRARSDLTLFLVAVLLLRVWARWLRQFKGSGVPYLLDNFVRRGGRVRGAGDGGLWVELGRGPLDVVVEMAGYVNELDGVPWLEGRRVRFGWRGA